VNSLSFLFSKHGHIWYLTRSEFTPKARVGQQDAFLPDETTELKSFEYKIAMSWDWPKWELAVFLTRDRRSHNSYMRDIRKVEQLE